VNTDRRTRERIRLFFWAVLTVVCVSAVLVSRHQQQVSLQQKVQAAQQKALRYTQNSLADRLPPSRVSHAIQGSGAAALTAQVKHDLFTDPRIVRVRVWRPDGSLVFTTDDPKQVGKASSDSSALSAALGGATTTEVERQTFAPDLSTTPTPTDLLATYVPLRVSDRAQVHGVVEIDDDFAILRNVTTSPWKQLEIAFGLLAILCLGMTILAFVWSRRPQEVAGFGPSGAGPSKRELKSEARDTKKLEAAQAEAVKLKARVQELEGKEKAATGQGAELDRLRARVAELEEEREKTREQPQGAPQPAAAADPAEVDAWRQRAEELDAERAATEGRMSQLHSRVTEVEAQLRLTTDQLRSAQQRAERAEARIGDAEQHRETAEQVEERLTAELRQVQDALERLKAEHAVAEQAVAEQLDAQRGELDKARAKVRMAEDENARAIAEMRSRGPAESQLAPDAAAKIAELEEALSRSEQERAMLRAGRPETVYEARNRELEEALAQANARLTMVDGAGTAEGATPGVDPGVIATLEERIAAAERRAAEAEQRLEGSGGRRRSRSRAAKSNGGSNGDSNGGSPDGDEAAGPDVEEDPTLAMLAASVADEESKDPDAPPIDGSELRSKLTRSADARRRGSSQTSDRR
jgi:hypothetical protein